MQTNFLGSNCSSSFLGMHATDCSYIVQGLYANNTATASLTWKIVPLRPTAPRITSASVSGGVLSVTFRPPAYFGVCMPAVMLMGLIAGKWSQAVSMQQWPWPG